MFRILNKDRWYLTGFAIYSVSFWVIIRLTVSMETEKNYFYFQQMYKDENYVASSLNNQYRCCPHC